MTHLRLTTGFRSSPSPLLVPLAGLIARAAGVPPHPLFYAGTKPTPEEMASWEDPAYQQAVVSWVGHTAEYPVHESVEEIVAALEWEYEWFLGTKTDPPPLLVRRMPYQAGR